MISFLVTYYNQKQYVDNSLSSIYDINFSDEYEVLVGDDSSSDGTVEEVKKWQNKFGDRLRVFVMDRGDGVKDPVVRASNLRKFLLRQCHGEYFCVLDGDDYYCDQDFIQNSMNIFTREADIFVVMFDYAMKYSGKIEKRHLDTALGRVDSSTYIRNLYSHAGACVMRKPKNSSFMNKLDCSLYYDDNDIVIYQLNFGNIWYINQVIYMYRQHEDSIWHSMNRPQQGILNVLGADNEIILAPEYSEDIYYRYRRDILYAYFRRDRVLGTIGEDFGTRYLNICNKNSLFLGSYFLSSVNNAVHLHNNIEEVEKIIDKIKNDDPITYNTVKQNVEGEMIAR